MIFWTALYYYIDQKFVPVLWASWGYQRQSILRVCQNSVVTKGTNKKIFQKVRLFDQIIPK
jgi:hypothetical protein